MSNPITDAYIAKLDHERFLLAPRLGNRVRPLVAYRAVELYKSGEKQREIRRTLGLKPKALNRILKLAGVEPRPRNRPWRPNETDQARELRESGMNIAEIARALGRSTTAVRKYIQQAQARPCDTDISETEVVAAPAADTLHSTLLGALESECRDKNEQTYIDLEEQISISEQVSPILPDPLDVSGVAAISEEFEEIETPTEHPKIKRGKRPTPPIEDYSEIDGERLARYPILALGTGDCRWPYGDPKLPGFGFCGNPISRPGYSYCGDHEIMAFQAVNTPTGLEEN